MNTHSSLPGKSVVSVIIAVVVTVATGFVGLGILAAADSNSCSINIFWGCNNGGGGGGGGNVVQTPCSSSANRCGMTNTGFISGGTCSATPPPDSSCPPPEINPEDFYAQPSLVQNGDSTTLYWDVDTDECTVTGGGLNVTGSVQGSVSTGAITSSTTYALNCGGTTRTLKINVLPRYQDL